MKNNTVMDRDKFTQRPNFLIITTDQQRWDALGANGNPDIQTPNLDRLAAEGVNFDHCFVQNPVCMPSRVSFLTGQYPSTLGITHMGVPVGPDLRTLPHLLGPYGYLCAIFGKLHFLPHANRDHREPHPDYGFNQLEISDEPGVYPDAYRAWVKMKDSEQLEHLSVGLPPARAAWLEVMGDEDPVNHPSQGGRSDFWDYRPFPGNDEFTHSAFVADRTINFLNSQPHDSPFLCIAGFYSPHAPWVVPQRFLDLYDPDDFQLPAFPPEIENQRTQDWCSDAHLRRARHGYYAMVSEVDHYIGKIIDTIESNGLSGNTIVIFTSDHGEWLGEHLRFGKGYPGHDPVSRVPLIVYGPTLSADQTINHLIEAVDVLPTILELAGIQMPYQVQGRSFNSLLCGHGPGGTYRPGSYRPRDSALTEHKGWKLIRTHGYRYLINEDGRESLWNLDDDLGSYTDLADDDRYQPQLADHRHRLLHRLLEMERPIPRTWPY